MSLRKPNIKNILLGLESSSPVILPMNSDIQATLTTANAALESLNSATSMEDVEAAQNTLKSLQSKSFLKDVEYSGYVHPLTKGFECFNSSLNDRINRTKNALENIITQCKNMLNQN